MFDFEAVNIFVIIVEALLILTVLVMLVAEIFLSLNDIKGDAISVIIRGWAYSRSFFITLAWGIVTGHLFLGAKEPLLANNTISVVSVAALVAIVALIGHKLKKFKINPLRQLLLFLGGAVIGHFIWSMNDVLQVLP